MAKTPRDWTKIHGGILCSNLLVENDFNLNNSVFGMESYNRNIHINGNWQRQPGTVFRHGTATVYFQGSTQTISGIGDSDFYNLDIVPPFLF